MKYRIDRNGDRTPNDGKILSQATDGVDCKDGFTLHIQHALPSRGVSSPPERGFMPTIDSPLCGGNGDFFPGEDNEAYARARWNTATSSEPDGSLNGPLPLPSVRRKLRHKRDSRHVQASHHGRLLFYWKKSTY